MSACSYTASIIGPKLYSGQGAFHRGGEKRREGYVSFPSCTSSRTQIGTKGWAVSPEISILSLASLPLREICQGASIQHNTHGRCFLKHNQRPWRPTHLSPAADPPPPPMTPPLLFFILLQVHMAAKLDVPITLWHCRSHSGCPEKRL